MEKFEVDTAGRSAAFHLGGGLPCLYSLVVRWTADSEGRIQSIEGDYLSACL